MYTNLTHEELAALLRVEPNNEEAQREAARRFVNAVRTGDFNNARRKPHGL